MIIIINIFRPSTTQSFIKVTVSDFPESHTFSLPTTSFFSGVKQYDQPTSLEETEVDLHKFAADKYFVKM